MDNKKNDNCKFMRSWIGYCTEETVDDTEYCKKHKGLTCSCGNQATHDCEQTLGSFICGKLLCEKCRKEHNSIHNLSSSSL